MLMNTSFRISKEEDFVFSFSLPVKKYTAPFLAKGHGPASEIWSENFETILFPFPLLPFFSLNYPVNMLGFASVGTATMSCPAALLSSLWEAAGPDTSLLCRSSCRAENKNLSRRYHRKAEAEGIDKPCSWSFMSNMILENSPKALRWQTSSICKGCSALQHGEAWNRGGAKVPSDIVYSKGLSKCGPWIHMEASASLGNLSKMHILRHCPRLAESKSLGKGSRDSNAYSSLRNTAAHIHRSMSIWFSK